MRGGAPLSAVTARYRAGEPLKSIAADFDVPSKDLREALDAIWTPPIAA